MAIYRVHVNVPSVNSFDHAQVRDNSIDNAHDLYR